MLVTRDGLKRNIIVKSLGGPLSVLAKNKRNSIKYLRLEGNMRVDEGGFYQLVAGARGRLRIKIDDREFGEKILGETNESYFPISLEAGWHRLFIEFFPEGKPYLKIVAAGSQVAEILADDLLRHQTSMDIEM